MTNKLTKKELTAVFNDCLQLIIDYRAQLEKFLVENPMHTMKAEVSIEIEEKIERVIDKSEIIINRLKELKDAQ